MLPRPIAFLLLFFLITTASSGQSLIQDADQDTRVQTEKNPAENIIRMDLRGEEVLVLRRNNAGFTLLEFMNSSDNIFIGEACGVNNTTGGSNTFLGENAGLSNTTGGLNTFLGQGAGASNATGFNNTFVGQATGAGNTGGHDNTFLGSSAGFSNTTGGTNTFVGRRTGFSNTTGSSNVFFGFESGFTNTTGQNNTFAGHHSGLNNTGGLANAFYGQGSGLSNSTGSFNTFLGASAGAANTTGNHNTFVGRSAGTANATGSSNAFFGHAAGQANTSGLSNTFLGNDAGKFNTTGSGNTFVGRLSGHSSNSSSNTFIGQEAGFNTTSGGNNTALGEDAGHSNTTGSSNTAVGRSAGDSQANNLFCTFLGSNADASFNVQNSTALGNGAVVNAFNKVRIGNTAVNIIEGQAPYTTSDGRFKSDVRADAPGLDFILGLEPVTYRFDYPQFSQFLGETSVDKAVLQEKARQREMGFIAQDVEKICRNQGLTVANLLHAPESAADNYALAYGQLVVPLVKAVQEQQAQIEAQQAQLEALTRLLAPRQAQATERTAPGAADSAGEGRSATAAPNPATDEIRVRFTGQFQPNELARIILSDAGGRIILQLRAPAQDQATVAIPLSSAILPGHYALTVQADDGDLLFSGLIVKQ